MAFDSGALWLWHVGDVRLARIAPETRSETITVDAPAGGYFVAVGDGFGWVVMSDRTLTRVSLPTG